MIKSAKEAREIIKRTKEDDPDFSCYFLAKGFLRGWNQHAKAAEPLVEAAQLVIDSTHNFESFADPDFIDQLKNALEKYKKEALGE